jgi:hypothetical protein
MAMTSRHREHEASETKSVKRAKTSSSASSTEDEAAKDGLMADWRKVGDRLSAESNDWLLLQIDGCLKKKSSMANVIGMLQRQFRIDPRLIREVRAMIKGGCGSTSPHRSMVDSDKEYWSPVEHVTINWFEKCNYIRRCYESVSECKFSDSIPSIVSRRSSATAAVEFKTSWISPLADDRLEILVDPVKGMYTRWIKTELPDDQRKISLDVSTEDTGNNESSEAKLPFTSFKFYTPSTLAKVPLYEERFSWITQTVALSMDTLISIVNATPISIAEQMVAFEALSTAMPSGSKVETESDTTAQLLRSLHDSSTKELNELMKDGEFSGYAEVIAHFASNVLKKIKQIISTESQEQSSLRLIEEIKAVTKCNEKIPELLKKFTRDATAEAKGVTTNLVKLKLVFAKELNTSCLHQPVSMTGLGGGEAYITIYKEMPHHGPNIWSQFKSDEKDQIDWKGKIYFQPSHLVSIEAQDDRILTTITVTLEDLIKVANDPCFTTSSHSSAEHD